MTRRVLPAALLPFRFSVQNNAICWHDIPRSSRHFVGGYGDTVVQMFSNCGGGRVVCMRDILIFNAKYGRKDKIYILVGTLVEIRILL
jgi:hypothetical protein